MCVCNIKLLYLVVPFDNVCVPFRRKMCRHVNAPLMVKLAEKIEYRDKHCVDFFKKGAQIVGTLPCIGNEKCKSTATISVEELFASCLQRNMATLAAVRQDENADILSDEIRKDSEQGRMMGLCDVESQDLGKILLAKRFSVEQIREDGTRKVRAIDDETSSGANLCTEGGDKISCQSLDALVQMIKQLGFRSGGFKKLSLWKADINAAYRRIPIREEDRWMAWVALRVQGQTKIARHNAAMFGARGSVVAWDRVGELLKQIVSNILKLPSLRWVGDYFGVEPEATALHAKLCFARVVRAQLGPDAIEEKKLESGNPLTILGIDVNIRADEIILWPTELKIAQWKPELRLCVESGKMTSGAASKLAGKLSFATQNCFKQFGRALIKPFYAQQYKPTPSGRCSKALVKAMIWWLDVFENNLKQSISLKHRANEVSMFCDASGSPPILSAVLFTKTRVQYCVLHCPDWILQKLESRNDSQIMAYEIMAIMMGLESFKHECQSSIVKAWTDNTAGESALRNKCSKAADHNMLVHLTWLKAAQLNAGLWFERVPSKVNIADGPTRPCKEIGLTMMKMLGAEEMPAQLPGELANCDKFKSL